MENISKKRSAKQRLPKQRTAKEIQADLESKFNIVMLGMIDYVSDHYKTSHFTEIKDVAKSFSDKKPEEPIAYFLYHIYRNDEYRRNIIRENDDFFLGKFHELDDNFSDTQGGIISAQYMVKLFEFKELWGIMDMMSKLYIKKCMKTLIEISNQYILTL